MTESPGRPVLDRTTVVEFARLLHDANDELSVATMQLELLIEDGGLDADALRAVEESLNACRCAAAALRQVWGQLDALA